MANIEELKSIFTNNSLGYINSSRPNLLAYDVYYSATSYSSTMVYRFLGYTGAVLPVNVGNYFGGYANVFCVKR